MQFWGRERELSSWLMLQRDHGRCQFKKLNTPQTRGGGEKILVLFTGFFGESTPVDFLDPLGKRATPGVPVVR